LITFTFAPNNQDTDLVLYGIKNSTLVKMTFTLDETEMKIVESYEEYPEAKFTGKMMRIEITDELIIVSNADGYSPGIYFYDYNLQQIEYIPRSAQADSPYNLEVYAEKQLNMLQIFVAGKDTISIVEVVKNRNGDLRFNTISDVFTTIES